MERTLKTKLLSYLLISSISFSYLILPQRAGISVPIFVVIQFICLFFIVPKKESLYVFIPIFVLSLNPFISGNDIWRVSNFFVTTALYSLMVLLSTEGFEIGESSVKFILGILRNIYQPFSFFNVPIKWARDSGQCALEANEERRNLMKRVLLGLLISAPCLLLISILLSSADEIFARHIKQIFTSSQSWLSPQSLFRWACGLAAGFYLFGLAYLSHQPRAEIIVGPKLEYDDFIIINIVLFSIVAVYTVFAMIQFQYLFASGGTLPYGLSYTHYARKGFFELLFLSGLNIFIILLVVHLTKEEVGVGAGLTKIFCCGLCLLTFILLVSSFYRMWLYNADSGLTRLRFLVFGFLIFEAIGLVFTFIYILKPRFNIIVVYLAIGLCYYLLLNLIPMDPIIAKSQIDRYYATGQGDMRYALSLSSDAAPMISNLLTSGNPSLKTDAQRYFSRHIVKYDRVSGWQKYNLSAEKCKRVYERETAMIND